MILFLDEIVMLEYEKAIKPSEDSDRWMSRGVLFEIGVGFSYKISRISGGHVVDCEFYVRDRNGKKVKTLDGLIKSLGKTITDFSVCTTIVPFDEVKCGKGGISLKKLNNYLGTLDDVQDRIIFRRND